MSSGSPIRAWWTPTGCSRIASGCRNCQTRSSSRPTGGSSTNTRAPSPRRFFAGALTRSSGAVRERPRPHRPCTVRGNRVVHVPVLFAAHAGLPGLRRRGGGGSGTGRDRGGRAPPGGRRLFVSSHEIEALLDRIVGPSPQPINTMDYLDWGVARAFGMMGGSSRGLCTRSSNRDLRIDYPSRSGTRVPSATRPDPPGSGRFRPRTVNIVPQGRCRGGNW